MANVNIATMAALRRSPLSRERSVEGPECGADKAKQIAQPFVGQAAVGGVKYKKHGAARIIMADSTR